MQVLRLTPDLLRQDLHLQKTCRSFVGMLWLEEGVAGNVSGSRRRLRADLSVTGKRGTRTKFN